MVRWTKPNLSREGRSASKTAASEIQNGKTGYSRRLINEAANALNIQPYELLLHPEDAMAIRQLIANADQVSDLGKRLRVVSRPHRHRRLIPLSYKVESHLRLAAVAPAQNKFCLSDFLVDTEFYLAEHTPTGN
jgi:hypothetical protein